VPAAGDPHEPASGSGRILGRPFARRIGLARMTQSRQIGSRWPLMVTLGTRTGLNENERRHPMQKKTCA